nr:MAG TPA: hypothetical protein [Bacteriophage sp.]
MLEIMLHPDNQTLMLSDKRLYYVKMYSSQFYAILYFLIYVE